ncbi:MAG TPA: DHA2 family efflux MFS transporter permease subunit [Streptosporangiaceae bacterium]|jgi:EmrB/QacA subfamily drug resistance transporter
MRKYQQNPWAVLLVVSLGFFMTLLDLTIVNIAIPNMIRSLHASLDDVLWVINAYALVLSVLVITAGRLGDVIGPRKMFMFGIGVFTLASAACGVSPSPGWLIAFRAVQGLGAAMLMPQTLTIITNVFPAERRGAAFGIWGAVAGVATIAGPTLGGLLVTAYDWRYIFYVNLPIGIAVLVLAPMIIPDLRLGRRHRLDVPGVLLASGALLAICYGLVEGQRYDWGTITSFISIPLVLGAGVLMLIAFLVVQWMGQDREPLVPFALFRDRNYSVINWVSGVLAVGMTGIFLPFTIYLQSVLGFSALKAGLTMAPASVISIFIAPVAGRLTDRVGGKYLLMLGLFLFAVGMGSMALVASASSSWQHFLPSLLIAGVGMGFTFAPLTTIAMRNVEPTMAGAASGVLNTVRQVGTVVGTAGVGALLQNRLASSLASQAAQRTAVLPEPLRGQVVGRFADSAKSGLQVGAGQTGTSLKGLPGLSTQLIAELKSIFAQVFTHGYVTAMRETMVPTVVLLLVGSASCFAIRRRSRAAAPAAEAPTAAAVDASA